jgi:hypothetical protein
MMAMLEALKSILGIKPKPRNVRPGFMPGAVLDLVYSRQRQPDGSGAAAYAFETLGLFSSSPISGAVRVRKQISQPFNGPQIWAGQAVKIAPTPSQAGAIFTGGMLKADGSMPDLGTYTDIDMQAVASNDADAQANSAAMQWGFNNPNGG